MVQIVCALLSLALVGARPQTAWELQHSGSTAGLRGIHAVGDGIVWASGTEGTVLRSEDGGSHWQRCATPPDGAKAGLPRHLGLGWADRVADVEWTRRSVSAVTGQRMAVAAGSCFSPIRMEVPAVFGMGFSSSTGNTVLSTVIQCWVATYYPVEGVLYATRHDGGE